MNFLRVSAACPITKVADIDFNLRNIMYCIDKALNDNSKLIVFPELCITSYTCADLFMQEQILEKSTEAIEKLCLYSKNKDILISIGAPLIYNNCLYNCAYIIFNGSILGIVPKSYIPNNNEFYEKRWFTEGIGIIDKYANLSFQSNIPFGTNLIFCSHNFKFAFEISEDLWVTIPPSSYLSLLGANIISNLSSSSEIIGKKEYRKEIVKSQSARGICSYIYASSGVYESSTDLVFSGHLMISENGLILNENKRFQRENEVMSSIIDIDKLNNERLKNTNFKIENICPFDAHFINFNFRNTDYGVFDRFIDKHPFIPSNENEINERCEEIFNIQTSALSKRLQHTKINKAVVGISGGLDSTLALLVVIKTFDMLNLPRKNIITITMPGFGTTDRTYLNSVKLCNELKTDLREINIVDACIQHFKDINHPIENYDTTYENVQARERTQILMDIANKENALLIGTGDLSELALGWCTYNGDHMSMYSINSSIPKTLVKYLVKYVANQNINISNILLDILDTPVSPELLPKDSKGNIAQKTENIIGPYELHDFFLYYFIRQNAKPEKILFLAKQAFKDSYSEETISQYLNIFIKRFFTQQFKRSAMPDGPKIGTINLSPRGDWKMPSDASWNSYTK